MPRRQQLERRRGPLPKSPKSVSKARTKVCTSPRICAPRILVIAAETMPNPALITRSGAARGMQQQPQEPAVEQGAQVFRGV